MTSHEFLSGAWFAGLPLLYSKNRQGRGATGRNVFYCVQLMQERIGLILVGVYKMQKFQRNHSGVLPCPYRGEPWDRGWQMEHTTWRRTSLVLFDNAVGTFFRSAPLRNGDWVNLFDRRNFVRHCSFLDNGSLITSLFNYFLLQWSPARHVGQLENQDWTELDWTFGGDNSVFNLSPTD